MRPSSRQHSTKDEDAKNEATKCTRLENLTTVYTEVTVKIKKDGGVKIKINKKRLGARARHEILRTFLTLSSI